MVKIEEILSPTTKSCTSSRASSCASSRASSPPPIPANVTLFERSLAETRRIIESVGAIDFSDKNDDTKLRAETVFVPAEQCLLKLTNELDKMYTNKKLSDHEYQRLFTEIQDVTEILINYRVMLKKNYKNDAPKHYFYDQPKEARSSKSFSTSRDGLTLEKIIKKASKGRYTNILVAEIDLIQVICYVVNVGMYIIWNWDTIRKCHVSEPITRAELMIRLKMIRLYKEGKTQITMWDVFERRYDNFVVKSADFFSTDPKTFSFFGGYSFPILRSKEPQVNYLFDMLVWRGICNKDKDLYEYLWNWMAFIAQNPGKRTEVALILTGMQGIGKSMFASIIARLFTRYSTTEKDLFSVCGKFNSSCQNKMIVVIDDLGEHFGNAYRSVDKFKSLITSESTSFEDKYVRSSIGRNVSNFIITTNHEVPFYISQEDRRFAFFHCSNVFMGNYEFFDALGKSRTDGFYSMLLTVLCQRDISTFNPRIYPMTEAKTDAIESSMDDVDKFILKYLQFLRDGLSEKDIESVLPKRTNADDFFTALTNRCTVHHDNRINQNVYKVSEEHYKTIKHLVTNSSTKESDHDEDETPQFFDLSQIMTYKFQTDSDSINGSDQTEDADQDPPEYYNPLTHNPFSADDGKSQNDDLNPDLEDAERDIKIPEDLDDGLGRD